MHRLKGEFVLLSALIFISVSTVGTDQAFACSCSRPEPASIIESADVAFEGQVVAVEYFDLLGNPCDIERIVDGPDRLKAEQARRLCSRQKTRLRVLKPLKGQSEEVVTIYTDTDTAACGYEFRKGAYLTVVAGRGRSGDLSTGLCSMSGVNRSAPAITRPPPH